MRGIITKKICKCPINGTVDGCSVNEQGQHENHSMRVRDTKKERNLKAVAKRGKDDEGGRPRPRFGYIFGTNSGGSHGSWKWAVAKTGVNCRMQEQEETKEESAGELEVVQEMRGKAERSKPMEAIVNKD